MIKIICVGKIKEKYLSDAINEYCKRLSKYTKLNIIELDDINNKSIDVILKKESEEILKYIDTKDYIVTMEIKGKELSSTEFANIIDTTFINYSNITFVIGGSYGLSNEIKQKSNFKLSFSKMTFPHQLFRVMLVERIYRAYTIINNITYHK